MFVARGHHFLPGSWKRAETLEKFRSLPPPTLRVLQLQSQIEGASRNIFMRNHENSRKFKKFQEKVPLKVPLKINKIYWQR